MNKKHRFYAIDNSASIYPAIINKRTSVVFRISVTLGEEVDRGLLQRALETTIVRYPYFQVQLKKNFFKYYFQKTDIVPRIDIDKSSPCRNFNEVMGNGLMFRVRLFERNIALEMSHLLTDGTGGMDFLKTMIAEYLLLKNPNYDRDTLDWGDVIPADSLLDDEEFSDGFKLTAVKRYPSPLFYGSAFRVPGTFIDKDEYEIDRRWVSVSEIVAKAKSHKVSLTEYLTAAYIFALQELYFEGSKKEKNSPFIRVEIPVNLRALFPVKSKRNFTLFALPEHDVRLGKESFADILKQTAPQIRFQTHKREIMKMLNRNVRGENNIIVKAIPRVLRDGILKFAYSRLGENQISGLITNLGLLSLPDWISREIDDADFLAAPSGVIKAQCGVISWGGRLVFNFGRVIDQNRLETLFFKTLADQGLTINSLPPLW